MGKKSSYQKLQDQFNSVKKELEETKNYVTPPVAQKADGRSIRKTIPFQQTLYRIRTDISVFKNALLRAENIQSPQRTELYRMYKHCMNDAHLNAVILNRKSAILGADFVIINNKGEEQKDLNFIVQSAWFDKFIDLSLDSMYYGYSLIDFAPETDKDALVDGEFTSINLVAREYVKPEFGIVSQTQGEITGVNYHESPYKEWCIGVGDPNNLGLISKASVYSIWKQGAIMAYAEFIEMCGIPIRVLKTDVYDEETRSQGENFMRNLGNSAYAVIGKDDEVIFAEPGSKSGIDALFNGMINKMDEQMSKLILGGSGMLDVKSFVGSANIHQDNFKQLCEQDKNFIENVLNYQLVPFLIGHGFKIKGCKIKIKGDTSATPEQITILTELLKTGAYKIPGSYITEKFGIPIEEEIDFEEISEPYENSTEEKTEIKNKIKNTINVYQPKRRK